MIKHISLTRKEYEKAYAILRYAGGVTDFPALGKMDDVTVDCAILSCEFRDSQFSGWNNRQRMFRFHQRQRRLVGLTWLSF
jgi:hypothetical protein